MPFVKNGILKGDDCNRQVPLLEEMVSSELVRILFVMKLTFSCAEHEKILCKELYTKDTT